ncbi:MAG: phosphatase PAP2 family protein [Candidatus Natronoplasma sp.]
MTWVVVFLFVPVLLYYKDRKRFPTYLVSLVSVLIITYSLKYGFGVPRPEDAALEVITPRFPSGHTAMAFTPILFFKSWKYRLPLLGYAMIVAYSRIYFDLHVPIDIVVSVIIAFSISLFFLRYEENINQKFSDFSERFSH